MYENACFNLTNLRIMVVHCSVQRPLYMLLVPWSKRRRERIHISSKHSVSTDEFYNKSNLPNARLTFYHILCFLWQFIFLQIIIMGLGMIKLQGKWFHRAEPKELKKL